MPKVRLAKVEDSDDDKRILWYPQDIVVNGRNLKVKYAWNKFKPAVNPNSLKL